MLTRLLAVAADRTRLVVLVAVAVLAGATGGAWAATNATGSHVTVTTVADEKGQGPQEKKADKHKAAKQKTPKAGAAQGVHGACVSAVARSDATGGKNGNHGGAVSRAAHTCPANAPGAQNRSAKPSKSPKPAKSPRPSSNAGKPSILPTPDPTTTTTATTTP